MIRELFTISSHPITHQATIFIVFPLPITRPTDWFAISAMFIMAMFVIWIWRRQIKVEKIMEQPSAAVVSPVMVSVMFSVMVSAAVMSTTGKNTNWNNQNNRKNKSN